MNLHQYMTPAWAAQELVSRTRRRFAPGTRAADLTCGDGAFLAAFPESVDVFGVEIDPLKAAEARRNTGRTVYVADILDFEPPERPNLIVGNPPFRSTLIRAILQKAAIWLGPGQVAALILPAHYFKSASKVLEHSSHWGIRAELLPYSVLYPMLKYPLVWSVFQRQEAHSLVGFALYQEAADVQRMRKQYRALLKQPGHPWREVVRLSILSLGGKATLDEIYAVVKPHRPTGNPWWREQVRKQLRAFKRVGIGHYTLTAAMC